jgi:antitoxin component YwqK of YwqJK toxin-antitoxin module
MSGVVETHYPSGLTKEKYYSMNGKIEGQYLEYREDGSLYKKLNYVSGALNGECYCYYPDGVIRVISYFSNGKANGEFRTFYENGSIIEIQNYKDNLRDGENIQFYQNGNISYKCNYEKGKKNGESYSYTENGILDCYIVFVNDNGIINERYSEDGFLVIQLIVQDDFYKCSFSTLKA